MSASQHPTRERPRGDSRGRLRVPGGAWQLWPQDHRSQRAGWRAAASPAGGRNTPLSSLPGAVRPTSVKHSSQL